MRRLFPKSLDPEQLKAVEDKAASQCFDVAILELQASTGFKLEACTVWALFIARERPHTPLGRTMREEHVL